MSKEAILALAVCPKTTRLPLKPSLVLFECSMTPAPFQYARSCVTFDFLFRLASHSILDKFHIFCCHGHIFLDTERATQFGFFLLSTTNPRKTNVANQHGDATCVAFFLSHISIPRLVAATALGVGDLRFLRLFLVNDATVPVGVVHVDGFAFIKHKIFSTPMATVGKGFEVSLNATFELINSLYLVPHFGV